jgi:preprotein translocase subunit SecF
MTILTSIILVVAVVAIALFIAYNAQRGTKALSEFKADYDNNAEAQEIVELAQELYNKDLRPVVAKKAPKAKKSEFPIDQPTKKTKAVEQVETIAEVVTPEVVETVKTVEAVVEPAKPKKKRKYYPRKPKTSI